MKKNIGSLLIIGLVLFLAYRYWPRSEGAAGEAGTGAPVTGGRPAEVKSSEPKAKVGGAGPVEERSTLADNLNSPKGDIRADLRIVEEILGTFRTNFPREGNPVGTNAEIVAVLTGKNKLHLALIPPDHPAINKDGELCDRWGTPFFFHAESGTHMTIESAGPDRKRHTADDVVFSP